MRPSDGRRRLLRPLRFEVFEERIALSAQPLGEFALNDFLADRTELSSGEVQTTLADVDSLTGIDYVRDTFGFRGGGQTVAVIDTGIAYDHYALGGGFGPGYRVVGGWDFTEENDADPYDDGPSGWHGTHVAGIVGSDDATYTGVAPDVDLVALRVFNDQGKGYFSWVESALSWVHQNRNAFDNPITAVNLSLGIQFNANEVPGWGMLEDEFSQLEQDGIFIAVAAGNAFTAFGEPGLSYPAVSDHVVPVASVTNAGSFSSFSQRNDRVIAAPGSSITSTVPDHLYSFDGVPNDFATASGTSMASPYMAGASVVVREAMEFVGYQSITQETIYDHVRSTADLFYDSATDHTYHRLNLQQAIDSLMPADDYGSSADGAYQLGTLVDGASFSGLIGRLDDQDYFTFTAAKTGVATFTAQTTHNMAADWRVVGGEGRVDGGALSLDVVAGQAYTVGIGSAGGIGYYDVGVELKSVPIDLGVVQFERLDGVSLGPGETWFTFSATRTGILTVEAFFSNSAGDVDLELYDADFQQIDTSATTGDAERVDAASTAGEVFFLKACGENADVDFRLTNLVGTGGGPLGLYAAGGTVDIGGLGAVDVYGTDGDDTFSFVAGTTHVVTVNGVEYRFDGAATTTVSFHGGAGTDSIFITGTAADDLAVLRPGSAELTGGNYHVHADGIERTFVFGGGGDDRADLYDSPGDDRFIATPTYATLRGGGFFTYVGRFDRVYAHATAGGEDFAFLHDSPGDDRFIATPTYATLRGDGFFNYAGGFDRVYAYANAGGEDFAYLHDSAGDDRFNAKPDGAFLRGDGFRNYAGHFDRVYAYANAGGEDFAYLHDSAGDDRFNAKPDGAFLRGDGFRNYAGHFDRVYAYATGGGEDIAYLHDSAGDDRFYANPDVAYLWGSGFYNHAAGFDRAYGYATSGGHDVAILQEVEQSDTLYGRGSLARWAASASDRDLRDFDVVTASSRAGQTASADIAAVDYLFREIGSWD